MGIRTVDCFVVACDGGCSDGGWEDGIPHFTSEAEAVDYLETCNWRRTGSTFLCAPCAARADCAATGHQWTEWRDDEHYGIAFRSRWCERCNRSEYSPEFGQVSLLREVEHIMAWAEYNETRPNPGLEPL